MAILTILHTGDMHNRLTEEKAKRLNQMKQSYENALLVDSGDAIWAGNILIRPGGEPVLKLMSSAGYDAMAMGNREFHFTTSGFIYKIRGAGFPVVCANIRSKSGLEMPVSSHIIKETAGVRIAVFGLCVPMITERSIASTASQFFFVDPINAAAEIVPILRKEADLVFALTHIGVGGDRELAERIAGVDLIIGGHTHTGEIVRADDPPVIHSGCYAKQVGAARFDTDTGLKHWELIEL